MGSIILLIGIIAGPLILFSTLNPIKNKNLITGLNVEFSITRNVTNGQNAINEYTLFKSGQVSMLEEIPDEDYKALNLSEELSVNTFDRSLIQEARLFQVSNSIWDITPPAQQALFKVLYDTIHDTSTENKIELRLTANFIRKLPKDSKVVPEIFSKVLDSKIKEDKSIIDNLKDAVDPSNECKNDSIPINIPNMYMPVVFLSKYPEAKKLESDSESVKNCNITLSKNCDIVFNNTVHVNYWSISQNKLKNKTGAEDGLYFVIASEKIAPEYFAKYTVIGFYTAIVLVISSFIRTITRTSTSNIFISSMQQPDVLLLLCEGVIIARMEGDTDREQELYKRIIDIMRSPSMIKLMTPSTYKEKTD